MSSTRDTRVMAREAILRLILRLLGANAHAATLNKACAAHDEKHATGT